jgi:dihydroorotase (multifunctional complex type)
MSVRTDMQPFDLVVRSQYVYTPSGVTAAQVAIRDQKIVGILEQYEACETREFLDAGQHPVIPGLVDTHCHFRDPGYTHKGTIASGTRAAALGGVTTVFDMPNTDPPLTTEARLREHRDYVNEHAFVDFGHNVSAVELAEIGSLARAGASAFKLWMSFDVERSYPHSPATALTSNADLYESFELISKTGLPLFVHPTDHELYNLMARRAQSKWGTGFQSYARAFREGNSVAVNAAVATLLELQRSVGTRLHVLHLSSRDGIRMVKDAKLAGRAVTAEANPFAMFVTNSWERIEKRGPFVLGQWVPDDDSVAMWDAIVDGTIDVIGSDHAPHTAAEKEAGWEDMFASPSGSPMVADYLSLLLTAVNEGKLTLSRVVELCCSAPAQLVGLQGRKGSIDIGADADLVVVDMNCEEVISDENSPYMCGWTPAAGFVVTGRPVTTILRGTVIADNGVVLNAEGFGQFVGPDEFNSPNNE